MRLRDLEKLSDIGVQLDGPFTTTGFLDDPQPGMLTFVEHRRFLRQVRNVSGIAGVITTVQLARELAGMPALAIAANPRLAFFQCHNHIARNTDFFWHDFPTHIDASVRIHPRACVAQRNVRIGAHSVIEANAVVMERCIIGESVLVRAGAILGGAAFQSGHFNGCLVELEHAGGVRVEDGAVIFAGAVIASAVFRQFTTIGPHARIGNLAFVSHNVQVGARAFVGHGAVVNGNVNVGADGWIGPGATISNNITIGEGAEITLGSAVIHDVPAREKVTGNIAVGHRRFLRHIASIAR